MQAFEEVLSKLEPSNMVEKKIIDAFMNLYKEYPIEKISIKTITDRAGLNRGTFYLHYLDIYDLLKKIEAKYHNISKYIATYSVNALTNNQNLEEVLPSMKFYSENLEYYKVLLCMDRKSRLPSMIKSELKDAYKRNYNIVSECDDDLKEYILEYIVSAQVATIIYWINNDMKVPIKKLVN